MEVNLRSVKRDPLCNPGQDMAAKTMAMAGYEMLSRIESDPLYTARTENAVSFGSSSGIPVQRYTSLESRLPTMKEDFIM